MALLELNLSLSNKQLRWFAGLWFPALTAMLGAAIGQKLHAPAAALSIWSLGGILSVLGLFRPAIIRPIYILALRLTYPIGWVVSHIMLLVLYFLVMTPVGFILRLFHDPMQRRLDTPRKSYWLLRELSPADRYFRQF
jgi:Saxitoxin biosynthesis operon protein SxtJ